MQKALTERREADYRAKLARSRSLSRLTIEVRRGVTGASHDEKGRREGGLSDLGRLRPC